MLRFPLLFLLLTATVIAQQPDPAVAPENGPVATQARTKAVLVPARPIASGTVVVPAGTKVPLVLKHAISTKTARPGDGVYLQTNFPVSLDNTIVIPPGTYVQGAISSVKRAGRMRGHAELLFAFTTLIFPNGYAVSMPGSLENVPGLEKGKMKGKEGAIEGEGKKGQDVATVAGTTATGSLIGLSAGARGAGIGAAAGGAIGLGIALLTRNTDVRLEPGTTVEMVLQRPLVLEKARLHGAPSDWEQSSGSPGPEAAAKP